MTRRATGSWARDGIALWAVVALGCGSTHLAGPEQPITEDSSSDVKPNDQPAPARHPDSNASPNQAEDVGDVAEPADSEAMDERAQPIDADEGPSISMTGTDMVAGEEDMIPSSMGDFSAGNCGSSEAYEALVPLAGETCYDLAVHGLSEPGDQTPFTVATAEAYNQFYYDVPWPAGSVATRIYAEFDNLPVLQQWRLFSTEAQQPHGTVMANVTGTTLFENARLLASWAVGGCATLLPDDVGLQLPESGKLMVQWYMLNHTGVEQLDGSKVQVCTVPAAERTRVVALTVLGNENIEVPPGAEGASSSRCVNDSDQAISIVSFQPQMGMFGANMKSVVHRGSGAADEVVFDQPYQFDLNLSYASEPFTVLEPGDTIETTCTFMNTSGSSLGFGVSMYQAQCAQYVYAYPAGALDNGVISLLGALNTCW